MLPSLPAVLVTLAAAGGASSKDVPVLCSTRQPVEVPCQQSISPGLTGAPALLANGVLSGNSPITGTVLSLSESVQVFPARLCLGQPALASSSLAPSGSWHKLAVPSRRFGQGLPAWQGDSLEQQRRGLPCARSPQSQARTACQHCHGLCLVSSQ